MLTWLADVLRAEGLPVVELEGWKTRGRAIAPQGVVCHHTATSPSASNQAVRALLRDGRPDLKGPLSQLGLERDGTWVVVAAGRCNHNGLAPTWGNDSIGVEAYNDGVGEEWSPVQISSFRRGVTAICRHQGWTPARVLGHKETDPTRKIDPTFDMDVFRASLFPTEEDMTAAQEAKLDDLIRLLTITVHHLEGNDAALRRMGRKRTSLRVLISRALKR